MAGRAMFASFGTSSNGRFIGPKIRSARLTISSSIRSAHPGCSIPIRQAQSKYGKRVVTGEEVRWGAENLNLDAGKIKALGFGDMVQPLKTSCSDHEGVRKGRIHTWDGKDWSYTSDWYEADMKILGPMIKTSAQAYAAEKKIAQRDCSKEK